MTHSVDEHRQMGVDLGMGATAIHVDKDRRSVAYVDATGAEVHEPFDQLVSPPVPRPSSPRRPGVPTAS